MNNDPILCQFTHPTPTRFFVILTPRGGADAANFSTPTMHAAVDRSADSILVYNIYVLYVRHQPGYQSVLVDEKEKDDRCFILHDRQGRQGVPRFPPSGG